MDHGGMLVAPGETLVIWDRLSIHNYNSEILYVGYVENDILIWQGDSDTPKGLEDFWWMKFQPGVTNIVVHGKDKVSFSIETPPGDIYYQYQS